MISTSTTSQNWEKKHWIITYHGFFNKNCEVGGLVIMHREKSRIWKKIPLYIGNIKEPMV
jgi:hypothetical protein